MRGRKLGFTVRLSDSQRSELRRWLRMTSLPAGLARRARVLLLLDERRSLTEAADVCGFTVRNARKWARRYLERGLDGLHDLGGRGRKPVFSPRGGGAPGEGRLRAARAAGPLAVAVGR